MSYFGVPKCVDCEQRSATAEYTKGSFCTECAAFQPEKGSWKRNYPETEDRFRRPFPGEVVYWCDCCKLGTTSLNGVTTLFYNCGHKFQFCLQCARKHKVCPKDPGFGLSQEGLSQLRQVLLKR